MEKQSKTVLIVQLMKKVMNTMRQRMHNHFKEINLTGPQGALVGTISHYGEMKVSDLSEILGLSNSTVSGIIDRLEKQGLIERIRSKEDRRVVYVKITDEYRKNSQRHFEESNKIIEEMMDEASPEELEIIFEGMRTLQKVMERQKE